MEDIIFRKSNLKKHLPANGACLCSSSLESPATLEGVQTLGCSFLGSKIQFCNFHAKKTESEREIPCLEQDYQSPSPHDACQCKTKYFQGTMTHNDHTAMVTGYGIYTRQKKILIVRCFADFQVFKEMIHMKLLL